MFDITLCGIDAAFVEDLQKVRLTDYVLSCFTADDQLALQTAINENKYHPAIIERFVHYQHLLLKRMKK